MHRWTIIILISLLSPPLFAQSDSSRWLNVYKSLVFSTSAPSLNADNGKHILSTQYSQSVNPYSGKNSNDQTILIAYGTQWRKHGFGAQLKQFINGTNTYAKTSYGLQYAYGFDFKKWQAMKRTRLILGIGMNYVTEKINTNGLTWSDMIDHESGFTNATAQPSPKSSVSYVSFDYQLTIRSPKVFVSLLTSGLPEPYNNFYYPPTPHEVYKVPTTYYFNSGVKVTDIGVFAPWLLWDIKKQQTLLDNRMGIALAYKNTWMIQYQLCANNQWYHKLGVSYYSPRIRAYLYYQNTPYPDLGYFEMGVVNMGLAVGIVKQKI